MVAALRVVGYQRFAMMRPSIPCLLLAVLTAFACSAPPKPNNDAGPDTSCGIDCFAQTSFGLLKGSCYEYSDSQVTATPPSIGVTVLDAVVIEDNLTVIPVEYRVGGLLKQKDSFTITNGALKLVRREFATGGSVSYLTSGVLTGATWVEAGAVSGQSASSSVTASVKPGSTMDATTYRVTLADAKAAELAVPQKTYDAGLTLLFSESPTDHGSDSKRVFVDGVGFILFSASFQASGGTTQEYRLQNVKQNAIGSCGI